MSDWGPVGIIGFGVFGRFMAEQLSAYVPVIISSRQATVASVAEVGARLGSLAEAAACPVVIPCVPVQFLKQVLNDLVPNLITGSMVVDVSSVKSIPVQLMSQILPQHCDILATHPLFGPQSGSQGIAGLPMVIWPVRISDARFAAVEEFLSETLMLAVTKLSPEEHDREMAYVQALTFFLGKAFAEINLPDTPLKTQTYQHLLDVKRIVEADTPELFESIQLYNPYAEEIRVRLDRTLSKIEEELSSKKQNS